MADLLVVDTSAWHRSDEPAVLREWREAVAADQVAVTPPMRLEVLYSARGARELLEIRDELDAVGQVPFGEAEFARAEVVQRLLGEQRALHHRSVKLVDLLIAAAAERAVATVWHYDEDYDRIAAVTGQSARWIVPRGSID